MSGSGRHRFPADDDPCALDLICLYEFVMRWRLLIAGITVLFTIAAAVHAYRSPRIYRAEAVFTPPTWADIEPLNSAVRELGLVPPVERDATEQTQCVFTTGDVYDQFTALLQSRAIRAKLVADGQSDFAGCTFSVQIRGPSPRDPLAPTFATVACEHRSPDTAAEAANLLGEMAGTQACRDAVEYIHRGAETRRLSIERDMQLMRKAAAKRRQDEIARLTESQGTTSSEEIAARIEALRSRTSDDPFIEELREIEQELARVSSIALAPGQIRAATLDKPASIPTCPTRPNVRRTVLGGVLAGLLAGFGLSFLLRLRAISLAQIEH